MKKKDMAVPIGSTVRGRPWDNARTMRKELLPSHVEDSTVTVHESDELRSIPCWEESIVPTKLARKDNRLLNAASRGDIVVLSRLLTNGADPDLPDRYGITPLMAACRSGQFKSVKQLLDRGANVNAADKEKCTVLMHACSEIVKSRIVEYLMRLGCDVHGKNVYGNTALMLAASNGNANVVRLLVQHGADVDAVSAHQETPLTFAVVWGHIEVVKVLLEAGVDVNWKDDHGWTSLKYALHEKRWKIANLLHDHGAQLAPLKNGAT